MEKGSPALFRGPKVPDRSKERSAAIDTASTSPLSVMPSSSVPPDTASDPVPSLASTVSVSPSALPRSEMFSTSTFSEQEPRVNAFS